MILHTILAYEVTMKILPRTIIIKRHYKFAQPSTSKNNNWLTYCFSINASQSDFIIIISGVNIPIIITICIHFQQLESCMGRQKWQCTAKVCNKCEQLSWVMIACHPSIIIMPKNAYAINFHPPTWLIIMPVVAITCYHEIVVKERSENNGIACVK